MIDNYIKEGKIVPVEVTVGLLKKAMEKNVAKDKYHFLIDGFPRNQANLEGWHKTMGTYADIRFVLFFDCEESVMEKRLLERGKTSGRIDDNIDSIKKR
jgi:UMP-CMP kinase